LHGQGKLISRERQPDEFEIEYSFRICGDFVLSPGFKGLRKRVSGEIRPIDGRSIPEGTYEFFAQSEIFVLKKEASEWFVVSPAD